MYVVRPDLRLFLPDLFDSLAAVISFRWYPEIEEIEFLPGTHETKICTG